MFWFSSQHKENLYRTASFIAFDCLLSQSAENRRKSVTDSGYAYVTQRFLFRKFERQPQRK